MIKIICVGKIKEKFISDGILEYSKRINGYTKFQIIEVKEYNQKSINENILIEGINILKEINEKDFCITLEIKGKMLDSIELSKLLNDTLVYNQTNICFIIGGSYGLSNDVISRSNYHLSFSKLTFPHQLMRLILTEQLYRAFTILNNQEYHK